MGSDAAQAATFIVSNEPDTDCAIPLLRARGWDVRFGPRVARSAHREILPGHRRILMGHGTPTTFHLVRRRGGSASRWLWVGMRPAPEAARLHLYSCFCGKRLAPALGRCFAVGHYTEVPIPDAQTQLAVLPFLEKVAELLNRTPQIDSRDVFLAELRTFCGNLVKTSFTDWSAWLAALYLSQSLYPRRKKGARP